MKIRLQLIAVFFALFITTANGQITGIKIVGDPCNDFTLQLQATGTSSSPYFFWEFDDPASGTNDTVTILGGATIPYPTHTFTSPGIYNVCVSFQEPGFPVSKVCRSISIKLCCDGIITTTDSCLQNNIPFSVVTDASVLSISWDFGDPASGSNNTSTLLTPSHRFSAAGNYLVRATVTATCGVFPITFDLNVVDCSNNCTGIILSNDSCLENGTGFQILSNNFINSINWNFNDPTSGLNNVSTLLTPTHQFSSTGNYLVRAIVNFSCGIDTINKTVSIINCTSSDTACNFFVPNVFTPNKDEKNDTFFPVISCPTTYYECLIFNRWGGLVYKTFNQTDKWDGKFNGSDCLDGVYFYIINYQFSKSSLKNAVGTITLLR